MEGDAAAALSRLVAKGKADAAAGWSLAVTRGLTRVVHRLSIARKAKRQQLPQALEATEALLRLLRNGTTATACVATQPGPCH